jgi:transcription elongation GreA/GreB family factor
VTTRDLRAVEPTQPRLFTEDVTTVPDIDEEEELEVEVGDTVTYAPAGSPKEPLTVQIVLGKGFTGEGLIAESTPLAQVLLGAVVSDQVVLRVPGKVPHQFVVQKIARAGQH